MPSARSAPTATAPKREEQRACDTCRRRKRRCDGGKSLTKNCSLCTSLKRQCTFSISAPVRHPPPTYVKALEARIKETEGLIRKANIEKELLRELGEPTKQIVKKRGIMPGPTAPQSDGAWFAYQHVFSCYNYLPEDSESDDDLTKFDVRLDLPRAPKDPKVPACHLRLVRPDLDALVGEFAAMRLDPHYSRMAPRRRGKFWSLSPHEFRHERLEDQDLHWEMPDADLLPRLIDAYFQHVNVFFPLLHRPMFEKTLLTLRQRPGSIFAGVVIAVCACGSRFVDDPRVLATPGDKRSAGWRYFDQLKVFRHFTGLICPGQTPNLLLVLQIYALQVSFLLGTGHTEEAALLITTGMRAAIEVGVHRNRSYRHIRYLLDELWKRCFWVYIAQDRLVSSMNGIPCTIQDEDFDLDLPLAVDDDGWDIDRDGYDFPLRSASPSERPSQLAFFVAYLQLLRILAYALRTLYAVNRAKILMGFTGPGWKEQIVSEIDSSLNIWQEALPHHLRWDAAQTNRVWLDQSSLLAFAHAFVQIAVHRFLLPNFDPLAENAADPSSSYLDLFTPSAVICMNALLTCAEVYNAWLLEEPLDGQQRPYVYDLHIIYGGTATLMGMVSFWATGICAAATKLTNGDPSCKTKSSFNEQHLNIIIEALKRGEKRWSIAGRLYDMIAHVVVQNFDLLPSPPIGEESNQILELSDLTPPQNMTPPLFWGAASMPVDPFSFPSAAAFDPTTHDMWWGYQAPQAIPS
ncbi:fungal-specific transcription factor domain-containing protein [Auriculariales sp. MPI-PUGE-AT-0066]|nr:fungal-specific transcription factor domain-containing protein [Auriculariales sp. MPI-PUGE-AT-0066]